MRGLYAGQPGRASKALILTQAHALIEHTQGSTMGAYVLLSLLTGARTEELRALTWSHLDLDGKPDADPPVLPHAMGWRSVRAGETPRPANPGAPSPCRSAASMPCASNATDRPKRAGLPGTGGSITIWCSPPRWAPPLDAANVRRGFRRIATAAGLNAAEWTPREL